MVSVGVGYSLTPMCKTTGRDIANEQTFHFIVALTLIISLIIRPEEGLRTRLKLLNYKKSRHCHIFIHGKNNLAYKKYECSYTIM